MGNVRHSAIPFSLGAVRIVLGSENGNGEGGSDDNDSDSDSDSDSDGNDMCI